MSCQLARGWSVIGSYGWICITAYGIMGRLSVYIGLWGIKGSYRKWVMGDIVMVIVR